MAKQKMTKRFYIVSGKFVFSVNARDEDEGYQKVENYLTENSPLRDWELDSSELDPKDIDIADINLP